MAGFHGGSGGGGCHISATSGRSQLKPRHPESSSSRQYRGGDAARGQRSVFGGDEEAAAGVPVPAGAATVQHRRGAHGRDVHQGGGDVWGAVHDDGGAGGLLAGAEPRGGVSDARVLAAAAEVEQGDQVWVSDQKHAEADCAADAPEPEHSTRGGGAVPRVRAAGAERGAEPEVRQQAHAVRVPDHGAPELADDAAEPAGERVPDEPAGLFPAHPERLGVPGVPPVWAAGEQREGVPHAQRQQRGGVLLPAVRDGPCAGADSGRVSGGGGPRAVAPDHGARVLAGGQPGDDLRAAVPHDVSCG
ncbi:hypothetical protein KL943_000856 [Ogataea angusta]|nr:hypothetical protein KL943_000856 [Ogataea angusta]